MGISFKGIDKEVVDPHKFYFINFKSVMFSLGLIFVRLDYLSVMMEEKYFDFLHIFGFSFVNLIFFILLLSNLRLLASLYAFN